MTETTVNTLARSPLTDRDLSLLKQTLLFSDDVRHLRAAGAILIPQIEAILDTWYGFVGSHPHLLAYFLQGRMEQRVSRTSPRCERDSATGFARPARRDTIGRGSTPSRRSRCGTRA